MSHIVRTTKKKKGKKAENKKKKKRWTDPRSEVAINPCRTAVAFFGTKLLTDFDWFAPKNGTAVLKGLIANIKTVHCVGWLSSFDSPAPLSRLNTIQNFYCEGSFLTAVRHGTKRKREEMLGWRPTFGPSSAPSTSHPAMPPLHRADVYAPANNTSFFFFFHPPADW